MLSRTAESLFWIGRHTERADGTARILDVQLPLLLQDPRVTEDAGCRALLRVLGAPTPEDALLTRDSTLTMLAVDRSHQASIAHSLHAARENAKRAREVVSSELWEVMNTTRTRMPRKVAPGRVHDFFGWVRERSALVVGIIESAASRDDAWQFFTLGRSLERAAMTARLVATSGPSEASAPNWTTILRSCGAHEAYSRAYRGVPNPENAAEFLLLDRLHPRSVLFSVSRAETCLLDIDQHADGVGDRARQLLDQLRSEWEGTSVEQLIQNLPAHMNRVQAAVSTVSDAVRDRYFPHDVSRAG